MPKLKEIHGYKWFNEDAGLIEVDITIEFENGTFERVPFMYKEGCTGEAAKVIAKDLKDNNPTIAPADPIEEAPLPTQEDYELAIQTLLETTAHSRRYNQGANAFATYVNSTDPIWAAEAQAFVAWRDAVWRYAYQQLDAVQAGDREQPSVEELLAELPQPNWPA